MRYPAVRILKNRWARHLALSNAIVVLSYLPTLIAHVKQRTEKFAYDRARLNRKDFYLWHESDDYPILRAPETAVSQKANCCL